MGFKDNFKQAAKELTEPKRSSAPTQSTAQSVPAKAEPAVAPAPVKVDTAPAKPAVKPQTYETAQMTTLRDDIKKNQSLEPQKEYETTVIAAGTVIQGSIGSKGNLEMRGVVTGDVVSGGTFILSGRQEGNTAARNAEFHGGYMKGDLTSTGTVNVDENTVIMGNIQADRLQVDGKIKGNLKVKDFLSMGDRSVVIGSVTAARVTMDEGAVFQGDLHISNDKAVDMFKEPAKSEV